MKKKILLIVFIIFAILSFSEVFALEVDWPPSPLSPGFTLTDDSTLTDMVRYFYEWGIFVGGIAVLFSLIIGGILYLTSAGDPAKVSAAKDRITSAIIGLVLLFSIYLILNTINPELTVLTPPTFEPTTVESEELDYFTEKARKSCEYVRFYESPYYQGDSYKVEAEYEPEKLQLTDPNVWGKEPKSARFFQTCDENEVCRCENGDCKIWIITGEEESETEIVCEEKTGETLVGDVNGDCVVNEDDLDLCGSYIESGEYWEPCDLNNDGVIDVVDLIIIGKNVGETCGCFKKGGGCTVELYAEYKEWWWLFPDPCGDKLGNIGNSVHNLKVAFQTEKTINCVKVTKTGL
jgi:hypothetical protein